MTTSEINALKQLCETERTQILTILSLAQTKRFMERYLLTGKKKAILFLLKLHRCCYMKANIIFHLYNLTKKNVSIKYHFTIRVQINT